MCVCVCHVRFCCDSRRVTSPGSDCSSSESHDSSADRNSPLSIIECNAGPSAEYCSPGEYCSVSSVDDFSPDPNANRDSLVYASKGSRSDADSSSPISVNGCSPGRRGHWGASIPPCRDSSQKFIPYNECISLLLLRPLVLGNIGNRSTMREGDYQSEHDAPSPDPTHLTHTA